MGEILASLPVLLALGAVTLSLSRTLPREQADVVQLSGLLHGISAFAQIAITELVYGGGDMFAYQRAGNLLADWARIDPLVALPTMVQMFVQTEVTTPFGLVGETGSSTGSMTAISGFFMLITGGSLTATCVLISFLCFTSKYAMFTTFCEILPREHHRSIALACMLVPSTVFWTSALLKEPIAMIGLGWVVRGLFLLGYRRQLWLGLAIVLAGAIPMYLVKRYLLVPFLPGVFVWAYARSSIRAHPSGLLTLQPARAVAFGALSLIAMAAFTYFVPDYSADNLSRELNAQQTIGARTSGGSNYALVSSPTSGLAGQILIAPLALLTALLRPFIFEIAPGPVIISAIEMTWLTYLAGRALVGRAFRVSLHTLRRSPLLLFCLAYVALCGTAVSLASTNLGSLARYRAPMLPFWVLVLLVLDTERVRATSAGGERSDR